ncbi:MAG TPA: class I SAM-dependent methyltransferase [Chitinophagaceae bacterium]|nr:class I SAM-dependent methyltransferase [Chitinophagaceae bacterium]
MNPVVHYTNCPVCNSTAIRHSLSAQDHTISHESFQIWECAGCSLRFTQDVPGPAAIIPYYKSEQYISHSNTSKGFINQLYQWVRRKTLRQKRKLLQRTIGLERGSLLDLGSGTGAFAHEMKQAGWKVMGLEPDADARRTAKKLYAIDLEDTSQLYPLPPSSFDAITLWHVLEHVHDLHQYVAKLKELLKENGKLFVAVPNYTSKDAAIYAAYWAAYDVPRHLYHFSPASIKLLMEKHGLRLTHYKPMWYDSFYISLLSSRYKNGSANLFAAFINGLRSNFKALADVKRCSSVIYIIEK